MTLNQNGLTLEEECHKDQFLGHYSVFILYANDLTQAICHSEVVQYADDTTISLVSNDVSGLKEGFVDDLEDVARWVEMKKLKLNGQKTQLLLLSRKRRAQEWR